MPSEPRLLLAIETSCDETAAAVVAEDRQVRSSIIHSQAALHAKWGGVVPDVASREHVAAIISTVDVALQEAGTAPEDLHAIAVTAGPGLPGSLTVGVAAAQALGVAWDRPVVGVNHLDGHLASAGLDGVDVAYPAVHLLVSGGHCLLTYAERRGHHVLLGETRDDSVGEAYDKVARELGLGYPGGPAVDKLAKQGEDVLGFPRPMLDRGYDFSFSGLKTAVRLKVQEGTARPEDVAASFAAACMDVLIGKLARAVREHRPQSAVVVGGVAASPLLRARLHEELDGEVTVVLPSLAYATDNAAMIGAAAWDVLEDGTPSAPAVQPRRRLELDG